MKLRTTTRAFTLVEILIAIVLIGAIGITTFSMFYRIAAMKEALSQRTMVRADLDAMTREIERALVTCFAAGKGLAFKGTSERIDIPCRIERLDALMATVSNEPSPPSPTEGLFSMWFDPASKQIVAATSGPTQRSASGEPLVRSVAALRFRYRVGDQWESSFTPSQVQGLPQAVEISVWLAGPEATAQDVGAFDAAARGGESTLDMPDDFDMEGGMPSTPADVSFVVTVPDAREETQSASEGA